MNLLKFGIAGLQSFKLCRTYKIYTRTGDKGTAALYNGERHSKKSSYFQALGDIDELNSHLGLVYLIAGKANTHPRQPS
jgi:cob(I)alamin adenosyltransferase